VEAMSQLKIITIEAGAVAKKAVYGSVGTFAGMGSHTLILCVGVFIFLSFQIM